MQKPYMKILLMTMLALGTLTASAQLFKYEPDARTRWSSPENINGVKGAGGKENKGAKGRPARPILPGDSLTLLDVSGTGIINRIWITVNNRSPKMLRSLVLEMFWDDAPAPAVSVPLADFFSMSLGRMAPFQNALFASPEGRSFNCFIPMPFKKAARIRILNESGERLSHVFFDVDYQLTTAWPQNGMYFHAYWHRDTATTLGRDYEMLPEIKGHGRVLGFSAGINANPLYGTTWWGEGEVKCYLDGDRNLPTLIGTGSEDYISDAWGQDHFVNDYTGCLISDGPKMQWTFYRYHVPDPIFFHKECRVAIQQIGSAPLKDVLALHVPSSQIIPTTIDDGQDNITPLYEKSLPFPTDTTKNDYALFYRSDDWCSTAYFYFDKPGSPLPPLQPLALRTYNLKEEKK